MAPAILTPPNVEMITPYADGTVSATGSIAQLLLNNGGDINVLKPWVGSDGYHYMNKMVGGELRAVRLNNATATLPYQAWIDMDEEVQRASMPRMRFVSELRRRNLELNLPNGLATIMLQYQTRTGITPATISMDGLRRSERDRPTFDTRNLPIPIITKDFSYSLREVLASRQGNQPLDSITAIEAADVVSVEAEKLAIGVAASYSYGGGTVYGVVNHPSRNTQVLTNPATAPGWTPTDLVTEMLSMIQKAENDGFYGPYMVFASSAWGEYMEADYSAAAPGPTLRERLLRINRIQGIEYLDYLGTGFTLVLIDMRPTVIREVVGMEIQTIQWQTPDGMALEYKVMAILVPQIRADPAGNCGIVHGSAV